MGTVLMHVGMPKTGSTSIQSWLKACSRDLRAEHGITVVRGEGEGFKRPIRLGAYAPDPGVGGLVASRYVVLYELGLAGGADEPALESITAELVDSLDELATGSGTVLLSDESLAQLFARGEAPFLRGLESLAERHRVRVACYVRPQHTALEARWRQYGALDRTVSPQTWVRAEAEGLRYEDMIRSVDRLAPSLSFEMRPFRTDVLIGGNVVADFASGFCGVDAEVGASGDFFDNRGLPLDLTILLRGAAQELPAAPALDGMDPIRAQVRPQVLRDRLRKIPGLWGIPESSAARRSREVLHAYSYQEFEAANRELSKRFGWASDGLIDPPAAGRSPEPFDLAELDRLWAPDPSTSSAYLIAALDYLMEPDR